jgi:uroporphyrinogen-III synthase
MIRMLVTRPEPDAAETAARLEALDIAPVICPLLRFEALPTGLPDPAGFAALALTSANALRALAARDAIARYRPLRVFAVGEKTAAAAREHGFPDVIPAGGSLGDLADLLAHSGLGGPVFYPAARHQSGDLARSLAPFGVMVVTARVYDMIAVRELPDAVLAAIAAGEIAAALFYSRRTAETFVNCAADYHLPRAVRTRLGALCLSENVAEPLILARFVRIALADFPSEEAMMGLCLSFARDQNAP